MNYLEKFEKMRVAGKLAAKTLDMLTDHIKPGVTTEYPFFSTKDCIS